MPIGLDAAPIVGREPGIGQRLRFDSASQIPYENSPSFLKPDKNILSRQILSNVLFPLTGAEKQFALQHLARWLAVRTDLWLRVEVKRCGLPGGELIYPAGNVCAKTYQLRCA